MEGSPSDTAREKVLGYIRDHGPCTDEAVQDGLAMNGSTQRPRRVELHRAGLIRHAGDMPTKSGRLAAAWEVSP